MRVFITGVGCVGKTTIGEKLAALLGCPFFDLDAEIETYFGTSIERLQLHFRRPVSATFCQQESKIEVSPWAD